MPQKRKQTLGIIFLSLIVVIYMIILGFYDYKIQDANHGTPTDTQVNEQKSQSTGDDATPQSGKDAALSAVEQLHFDMLGEVEATISGAAVDELIADLPAKVDLEAETLFVVNPFKPFEKTPAPDLVTDQYGYVYAEIAREPYAELEQAALEAGHYLIIISAFRSVEQQQANRESMMDMYLAGGMPEDEAEEKLNQYVAPANASEHTTGLAFDVVDEWWYQNGTGLNAEYATQESAVWLFKNAPDFGFILRYPKNKDHFTGYEFEPWHYRFVGVEHAQYMHKHGLTLEEYCLLANERERRETGKLNLEAIGSITGHLESGMNDGDQIDRETESAAETDATAAP